MRYEAQKTFAEVVGELMHEKGMNASQLADASGLSRFYVSKLFHGAIKEPTLSKAVALANSLDVPLQDIVDKCVRVP